MRSKDAQKLLARKSFTDSSDSNTSIQITRLIYPANNKAERERERIELRESLHVKILGLPLA